MPFTWYEGLTFGGGKEGLELGRISRCRWDFTGTDAKRVGDARTAVQN
jgi:hypothetical protein